MCEDLMFFIIFRSVRFRMKPIRYRWDGFCENGLPYLTLTLTVKLLVCLFCGARKTFWNIHRAFTDRNLPAGFNFYWIFLEKRVKFFDTQAFENNSSSGNSLFTAECCGDWKLWVRKSDGSAGTMEKSLSVNELLHDDITKVNYTLIPPSFHGDDQALRWARFLDTPTTHTQHCLKTIFKPADLQQLTLALPFLRLNLSTLF